MQRPQVVSPDPAQQRALATVHLIRSLSFAYHRRVADAAGQAGIPVTDLRALVALLDAERGETPVYAGDLAHLLDMSSQATTALLRRLEAAGHIERRRDPQDGRHVRVVISEQALDLGWRHFGPIVEDLLAVVRDLGDEERALVEDVLRRSRAALDPAAY